MSSIAWTGSSVAITATDSDGNLEYWWQAADTTAWHKETVATRGANGGYGNPSIAWTGSSVVITALADLANLDYWWQAADTTAWNMQQVAQVVT